MKSVEFKNYSFLIRGQDRVVVNGHLNAQELLHISGGSGIGKTTLLRSIAGFMKDSEQGSLELFGTQVMGKEASKRHLAVVFQGFQLFSYLSVFENLLISFERQASLKALSLDLKKQRIEALLKSVELFDKIFVQASTLSGGEHQRVAICRALLSEAPLLVLDEPYSALDARLIVKINELIQLYMQKHKASVIVTSHRRQDFWSEGVKEIEWKTGQQELSF
jgi:ABC-type multidrug transport system ATPase subunit